MPTYVYKFIDTGETIEVQQAFTDAALTEAVHPATGETLPVKKVYLPVGITFKGDGFYKTDSRGSKGSSTPKSVSSDGASSESGSASSTSSTSSDTAGAAPTTAATPAPSAAAAS